MAEQLNMGALNLNDSQHASNGFNGERSAYIPPHMRGASRQGGPSMDGPPMMGNGGGIGGSAWAQGG